MIEVNGLHIHRVHETLIDDLNVNFKVGQLWTILGKNGSGKSTLLNTLAGFMSFKRGSITMDGLPLTAYNHLLKAQKIAFLPQVLEASLNCTVQQSISYARYPWHKTKTEKHTESTIITNAIDAMELYDLRNKNIQNISGGELRKVEIATILAQNSKILMLDEPLNHLDLSFRIKLMQQLKQLSQNKIIIIVTHDIQYVQEYCSHVIMIMNDKKCLVGEIKHILNEKNLSDMLGMTLPSRLANNLI